MVPRCKSVELFEGLTMTSAGTVFGSVDTKGADFLVITIGAGTGAAASTAVTALKLVESDTAMTALTDGTAITACVAAAAVSTSAGFVLPALSSTKQNTYQFNVNLNGRKRYIGAYFAPTLQTVGVSGRAQLFRVRDSAEIATVATGSDGLRSIVNA